MGVMQPQTCSGTARSGSTRRAAQQPALGQDGGHVPLAELARRPNVIALAGIANPERFFDMLRARGIAPAQCIALPDHYDFDSWSRPSGGPYSLICTEKDAAKLWRVAPDALAVPLVFAPEPAFFAALDARL